MIKGTYWCNSKFAYKLRGVAKPKYLPKDEWDTWKKETKANHPIRYYLAEELLPKLENITYYPIETYRSIKYYIINRFINKSHLLTTTLEKGDWYDSDTRILYGVFNELKNFVDNECSHCFLSLDNDTKLLYNDISNKGIAYLMVTANLKYHIGDRKGLPNTHALDAITTLDLYEWWNNYEKKGYTDRDYEEENRMLVKLISIRRSLWT